MTTDISIWRELGERRQLPENGKRLGEDRRPAAVLGRPRVAAETRDELVDHTVETLVRHRLAFPAAAAQNPRAALFGVVREGAKQRRLTNTGLADDRDGERISRDPRGDRIA